jgi:hypothetical protein
MICPLIGKCTAKVSIEHYTGVCANVREDAFKNCAEFKKVAGQQMTPSEWQKLIV